MVPRFEPLKTTTSFQYQTHPDCTIDFALRRILFQETSQLVERLSLPFLATIKKRESPRAKKVQSIKDAFFLVESSKVEDKEEM